MHDDRLLPDVEPVLTHLPAHGFGRCACHPSRRLFGGLVAAGLAAPALAREGVEIKKDSWAMRQAKKVVTAEMVEQEGARHYVATKQQASAQGALVSDTHPQVQRLVYIGRQLLPHAPPWNARAAQWRWEVNLIRSEQVNAFCMPGGKIAFFSGILVKLKLEDDEVAAIMGHEIAHALQEHARERMAQQVATRMGVGLVSSLLGVGELGNIALSTVAQLGTLKFGRDDEREGDLIGLELAARGGYDPSGAVRLWQKMATLQKGAPPQWMSTHPSSGSRISELQANLPKVAALYQRAPKPDRRFPVATA